MYLAKYSRILVLLSVSFACVALNYWLITNGHYRLPLFVFIGAIGLTTLALRRLPRPTRVPQEINNSLLRASGAARRLGYILIAGFAVSLLRLYSGDLKEFPIWGAALLFAWGGFLIWACFRGARWLKERVGAAKQQTPEEIK